MTHTAPLLFVEPLARGFRLEVLARAIAAVRLRSERPVFVVTRADYACRELARWIDPAWREVYFVPCAAPADFDGASAATVGAGAVDALLDAVVQTVEPGEAADLVLFGADDYLDGLAARAASLRGGLGRARIFAILYNTADLVAAELARSGETAAGRRTIAALEALDATLLALDETLRGRRIGARPIRVLPDPWHGPFAPAPRERARAALGLAPDSLLVAVDADSLLDGTEPAWLAAAYRLGEAPSVQLALLGNVWALRHPALKPLVRRLGARVIHGGQACESARDVSLMVAADVLLGGAASPPRGTGAARRARAAGLGAAFDRDLTAQLPGSVDAMRRFSAAEMTLLRGELDRLAHERLLRLFGLHFRAALRGGG